jgi:hypothetical protein
MATLAVLGQFFIGVGLLLIGCAALWFVTVYAEKNGKKKDDRSGTSSFRTPPE